MTASSQPAGRRGVPLREETRLRIPSGEMAPHLGVTVGTLHKWNHFETYPPELKPIKIGNKLMWPVAGALKLLGEGSA